MPQYIMHHQGVYNFWTTVADGPCFESGLTLAEVKQWVQREGGRIAIQGLHDRLIRAHAYGTSSVHCEALGDLIRINRCGPDETPLSEADFIAKYLTINDKDRS